MKYVIGVFLALIGILLLSVTVMAGTPPLSDMSTVYDGQPVVGIDNSTVVMSGMDFVYNAQPIVGIVSGAAPTYEISNSPVTIDFGLLQPNSTVYSGGGVYSNPVIDAECYLTITNNDASNAVKINIGESNPTGGVGWTLAGSAGLDTIKDIVVYSGGSSSGLVLTNSDQVFIPSIAAGGTKKWDLERQSGTFSDGALKTSTITLTGVAP